MCRVGAQEGDNNFHAVWDHWLLDTLSSWHRQTETSYAIELDDERAPSPPEVLGRLQVQEQELAAAAAAADSATVIEEDAGGLPPKKRARADLGVNGAGLPGSDVAGYLQQLQPPLQVVDGV